MLYPVLIEAIKRITDNKVDMNLNFRFNERSNFCEVILSHPDRTGFECFDIPLNDTKEANNE